MTSTKQTVICEEIFDDTSHPSISEIREYASKIGIDPDSEPQLLPLAAEGLMKPLPTTWKPCYDDKKKAFYYHNLTLGKTQWEHPLDNIYRDLVTKARTESQSLSFGEQTEDATYTRDDLPSYEEPFPPPRHDVKLSPLKTRPKLGDISKFAESSIASLAKQKSEDRPTVGGKINLSLFSSFDETNLKTNKSSPTVDKQELKVSGGGSMFLKSYTKKQNDVIPKTTVTTDTKKQTDLESKPTITTETDGKPSLRSILRENPDSDKTDKEEDDKKSVRFNMETTPNLYFISDDSETDSNKNQSVDDTLLKGKSVTKSRFTVVPVEEKDPSSHNNLGSMKVESKENTNNEFRTGNFFKKLSKLNEIDKPKFSIKIPEMEDGEDLKKNLLSESQETIQNYKDEILKTQNEEMQKILTTERNNHESYIKDELEKLRADMETRLSSTISDEKLKLELRLESTKQDLEKHYEIEERDFEQSLTLKFETKKQELEKLYDEKLVKIERELDEKLEKHKDELIVSHNAILDQIRQNHSAVIDELQKDYKSEEDIIRREHHKLISELRNKATKEVDAEKICTKDVDDERLFEKVRCEKRLLEDKYRCLKDKYLKLKTEVKLSIEKRNRKKEQNLTTTTTTTTGSETEKSPPEKKERIPHHSPSTNRRNSPKHSKSAHNDQNKYKSKVDKFRHIVMHDQDTSASDPSYILEDKININDSQCEYDSSDLDINPGRSRKKLFSRLKSSTTASRINNNIKSKESLRSCSPVENLRKQLQKLEDLEDQFPQNAQGDTYHLRYPFSDGQKFEGSSELEFFRHRIHLERDSIRRAKDSLRKQKSHFKQRQSELKLKHGPSARNTLKQLYQEEKELTDMEVSLHRTRSLLGEKVIRLRHLEQSLHRATGPNDQQNQDDATLSDLSSHSASSGISSSDFIMADTPLVKGTQFKESSEIIQSLENLNLEIREIWDVLHKQQQTSNVATVFPPLPLIYPDLGWPLLAASAPVPPSIPTLADRLQNYRQHVALANAQSTMVTHDTQGATTTLVEKTRNLRQWLRQTTVDANIDGNVPEATL